MGKQLVRVGFVTLAICLQPASQESAKRTEPYLRWTLSQAEAIGKSTYVKGRVGGLWGWRGLKTERAQNYKLAATWLTPEVIRASARFTQLRTGLTDEETRELVEEAEAVGDTVVMVEIDPREGSGVIPQDWLAFLHPKGVVAGSASSATGANTPRLTEVRGLRGVKRRNYDYDRFWVVFPLRTQTGQLLFPPAATEAQLVVRIYDAEGRVRWRIPQSIRDRMAATRPATTNAE